MNESAQNHLHFAIMPFMPICVAFITGILIEQFLPISFQTSSILFAAGITLLFLFFFKKSTFKTQLTGFILLLFCLMGMSRYANWKETHLQKAYSNNLPIVAKTLHVSIKTVQKGRQLKAIVDLIQLQDDSLAVVIDGQVLVYFPNKYQKNIRPGQYMLVTNVQIEKLPDARNPGQFDYGKYLKGRGIVGQCRIKDSLQIHFPDIPLKFSFENYIFYPLRQNLRQKLEQYFAPYPAAFLKALLLGVREDLQQNILEDFQKAGVMHVLAISGLHVGYVALIFYFLLSLLPIYFKYRNYGVIILLALYMLLTNSNPPVVRATVMAGFFLLSINLERRGTVYNFLFAAAFIILLFQPQQVFWVSFQFSFAAVISIVYFYQRLKPLKKKLLAPIFKEQTKRRVDIWLITPFFISLAAQIGTIPLVMHYFHKFSLISFVLNIVVIPYIGIIVMAGFFFLVLTFLNGVLAGLLAGFISFLIDVLIKLVGWAANLPASYFNISNFGFLQIIIYLSIVMLIFNFSNKNVRKIFITSTIVFVMLWGITHILEEPKFNLIIMDVGQGDAALITTPQKKVILIDAGPTNDYRSAADVAIIPTMQYLNKKRIDYLFISHPHEDHLGGVFRLLEYASVDSVYLTYTPISYHWNDTLLQVLQKSEIPYRFLESGDQVIIDKETRVYTLWPMPKLTKHEKPTGHNINNNSLVLLLKHHDQTLLFTGDIESEVEHFVMSWKNILKSEFMKVGHHGSITSTTEDFLALVNPVYASISVSKKNNFGHPSPIVLKRLESYQAVVFRTDLEKAIWLQYHNNHWNRVLWD